MLMTYRLLWIIHSLHQLIVVHLNLVRINCNHSTTKYMDGHAVQVGGVIVDSGKFNWANGKFPEFTEPDESYHGVVYTERFGNAAYIVKARTHLMRDLAPKPLHKMLFCLI